MFKTEQAKSPTIGFIGQGFLGKNYADVVEARGYSVVRYALEEPHIANRNKIALCDIVFIAVPTPTTSEGFDDSIVQDALGLIGTGKTAVIKSTIIPGTTERLQRAFPDIFLFHSPEFLREAHAAHDAAHPKRTIIGTPEQTDAYYKRAKQVLSVLPDAPYERIMSAGAAELVKYAGNCFLFTKVLFMGMLHDLARELTISYDDVAEAMKADPRIGESHMQPVHQSGHPGATAGRGAGGHCFIKDFAAFAELVAARLPDDERAQAIVRALEEKNIELLRESGKDIDLLNDVYGKPKA